MSQHVRPAFQAFLSYAHGDDDAFVAELHARLTAAGGEVWWDRTSMRSRMLTFLQEIQIGLAPRGRVVAIVTPRSLTSAYTRYEWQVASLFSTGIVPLLRSGTAHELPDELRSSDPALGSVPFGKYHVVDARPSRPLDEAVSELIKVLSEPIAPLATLSMRIPALPLHFRPALGFISEATRLLLADVLSPVPAKPETKATVLVGMGGLGKTMTASALARQAVIRRSFTQIGWATLGQTADAVSAKSAVCESLGIRQGLLANVLGTDRVLLVLDDVWQLEQIQGLLNGAGPTCRLVITTRDRALATSLAARSNILEVPLPDASDAEEILNGWSGSTLPPKIQDTLIDECGRLPLALALCGAMVANGVPGDDIVAALQASRLDEVTVRVPPQNVSDRQLFRVIHRSVEALSASDAPAAERYLELAAFRGQGKIPAAAVLTLWRHTAGLDQRPTRRLLAELDSRCLLRLTNDRLGQSHTSIELHDLQRDYLKHRNAALESALDARVLQAYRQPPADEWHTVAADGYIHRHLLEHLRGAGRTDEATLLLMDPRWLEAKLGHCDVWALLADYDGVTPDAPAALVRDALRQSAKHLLDVKYELMPQLRARIDTTGRPELEEFFAAHHPAGPCLMPLTASRTATDRLIATYGEGYENLVWIDFLGESDEFALAVGQYIVIRHTRSGSLRRTLDAEEAIVAATSSADGSRIVAATATKVRIWRTASGALETEWRVPSAPRAMTFGASGDVIFVLCGRTRLQLDASTGAIRSKVLLRSVARTDSSALSERWVATVSGDMPGRTLWVYSIEDGHEAFVSPGGPLNYPDAPCLSRDATRLYFASKVLMEGRSEVLAVDLSTGQATCLLSVPGRTLRHVALDPSGAYVLSASDEGIELWAVGTPTASTTAHLRTSLDAHGRTAAIGLTKEVTTYAGSSVCRLELVPEGGFEVDAVALDHSGGFCAVGEIRDRVAFISLWDLAAKRRISEFAAGECQRIVKALAVGPEARQILASTYGPEYVLTVGKKTGAMVKTALYSQDGSSSIRLNGHADKVVSACFSTEQPFVFTASTDRTVRQWDTRTGESGWVVHTDEEPIQLGLSGDCTRIASILDGGRLNVYDAQSGDLLSSFDVTEVRCVGLDRTGEYACTGGLNGKVSLWNVVQGSCLTSFTSDNQIDAVGVSDEMVVQAIDSAGRRHHLRFINGGGEGRAR